MGETTTAEAGTVETFSFRNPQTKQDLILPKKIGEVDVQGLLQGVIAKSNEEFRAKYKTELEDLRGQLSEKEKHIEEVESATLPAKEKEAREAQKSLEKFQKELEKERQGRTQFEQLLKSEKLSNALMREAAKYPDIINIEQTTTLFQAECSPTLSIDGENVRLLAKLNGEDNDMSETFSKWLASDRNANLLKNKLHPGSGSAGGSRATTAKTMTRAQFDALGSTEKMQYISGGGGLKD